ncbi:MAG: GEVED domain-containing protein, partial [Saprospiraceae bacterium]
MRRIFPKFLLFAFTLCLASVSNAQVTYYSLSGATDFASPASWTTDITGATSVAPPAALTNADNFSILAGASMILNADATVRQLSVAGSLSVAANTLYVEHATGNRATMDMNGSGALNLSGGAIKVKGSVWFNGSSAFVQSAGDLYIDGNSGTTGSGTNPLRSLLGLQSSVAINVTGGSWTFPDPQGNTSTTGGVQECIYYANSINYNLPPSHIIKFGDGVSTSNGGTTNGFRTTLWWSSGYLRLGSVVVDAVNSATNRFQTHQYTPGLNGDLTVISGECRFTTAWVAGNVTVNSGAILTVGTLGLGATTVGTSTGNAFSTNAQSITNNGTIKSAASAFANLQITSLIIANNNPAGITLNSPLNVGSLSWTTTPGNPAGIINTTATNRLRIVNSTGTGVTATTLSTATTTGSTGDSDAFVKGPLQITLGTGFSSSANIVGFPVGAATFNPMSFTGITGAPSLATTIQVEAFDSNAGSPASGVGALPSKRWDVNIIGTNSLSAGGLRVRVSDAAILGSNLVLGSSTAAGSYGIVGGSSTFTGIPSATYNVASIATGSNITALNLTGSYSFGDSTAPPSCVTQTAPATAAVVTVNPTLTWTAGVGASSYDVYISTTSPAYDPLNAANNLVTNTATLSYVFNVPAANTYYWSVVAKNLYGSSTGCTEFSFVAAAPNCATTTAPAAAATGVVRNPTFTWTAPVGGASSYDLYLSTTSPAFDPMNPATNLVLNQTGTSYTYPTLLPVNQLYYWTVVPKNTYSSATACAEQQFTTGTLLGYCVPVTTYGCSDGDVIARVKLNTLDNNSGTGCPSQFPIPCGIGTCTNYGGYSDYRSNPLLTTTLNAGTTYQCQVTAGPFAEGYAAWIDFNDDGLFDQTTERLGFSNGTVGANTTLAFPISLPCNPPVGTHTLRVRCMYAVSGNAVTPCTNNTYGEVEDYAVTVAPPPPCPQPSNLTEVAATPSWSARTFDWTPGCTETEWELLVQSAGGAVPTSTSVATDTATVHPFTSTGLPNGTAQEVWVRAKCGTGVYSDWTGPVTFTTPVAPPDCATLITPLDMATAVPLGTPLTWSAPTTGGAVANYKVFVGTSLPATPTATVGSAVLSYTPAGTYSTTYVWQVIASNATGDATGCPTYSYTTDTLTAPICNQMNVPANGATNVVKNPTLSWNLLTGADGYKVYMSTTIGAYNAATPTVNLIADVTTSSFTITTALATNTTYYWIVIPYNSKGNATGCVENTFETGVLVAYCVPVTTAGCSDGDVIARVKLNTLDNNSGVGCPSQIPLGCSWGAGNCTSNGGYSDYRTNPLLTTTLNAGTTYVCEVTAGPYSEGYAAWIDFNDDGVFDQITERLGYSNGTVGANTTLGFPISLPCNPPVGVHTLRVRCMFAVSGDLVTPCTNNFYGEVEDYVVTVAPPPPCPQPKSQLISNVTKSSADFTWAAGCLETMWDVHIQPASGITPTTTISNPAVTVTSVSFPGLSGSTQYEVWMRAVCSPGVTSDWVGPINFSTLLEEDEPCGAVQLVLNAPPVCSDNTPATAGLNEPAAINNCSAANNTVWYKFTAVNAGEYRIVTSNPTTGTPLLNSWIMLFQVSNACGTPSFTDVLTACTQGCNGAPGNVSTITLNNLPAGEYYVYIDGNSGSFGKFCINVDYIVPPFVNARVLLGNASSTGIMPNYFTDPANSFPNFPVTDPYATAQFNSAFVHVPGGPAAATTPAVLAQT